MSASVAWRALAVLFQERRARFCAHVHRIGFAQVGQVQIIAVADSQRAHALAERVLVAGLQALDAYQQRLFAPLEVMGIGETLAEGLVQHPHALQIAGVDTQDHRGRASMTVSTVGLPRAVKVIIRSSCGCRYFFGGRIEVL